MNKSSTDVQTMNSDRPYIPETEETKMFIYLEECKNPARMYRMVSAMKQWKERTRIILCGKSLIARILAWFILRLAAHERISYFKNKEDAENWLRNKRQAKPALQGLPRLPGSMVVFIRELSSPARAIRMAQLLREQERQGKIALVGSSAFSRWFGKLFLKTAGIKNARIFKNEYQAGNWVLYDI